MAEEASSSFNSHHHETIPGTATASNAESADSTSIKKPLRKFKSQSVNNLFKQNSSLGLVPVSKNSKSVPRDHYLSTTLHFQSHLSSNAHPTPISNSLNNITSSNINNTNTSGYSGPLKYSSAAVPQLGVNNKNGVKTLALASGPKLKIIPEKRLTTPLGQNTSNSLLNNNSPFTSKLINDDNNYWKKSRSTSPDVKKDTKPKKVVLEPKKVESSRFTFSNILLPQTTTSGFNWADIDDEDDDSFNDKIWSSLATHVEFPDSSKSDTKVNTATTSSTDILSPSNSSLPILAPNSLVSPQIDNSSSGELFSPLGDHSRPISNGWNSASSILEFGRHGSSSLSFNEHSNRNINNTNDNNNNTNTSTSNNGQYFNKHNSFRGFTGSLSSSFDKLSFLENNNNTEFTGSDPVKQELFNPITGKIEVFATNNPTPMANANNNVNQTPPHHHHSFDSSYINHNSTSKLDLWKTSSTVWNSRENSLTNTAIPNETFSPKLTDSITSPGWSTKLEPRNNSDSFIDVMLTTPNTLRGLSRFFPSPMAEQNIEYFPQQNHPTTMKRHSSDPFDPLSVLPQSKVRTSSKGQGSFQKHESKLVTTSQPSFQLDSDENDIRLSLPSLKSTTNVSTAKETIEQFVLNDSVKHPEGFSSTFYKRGVNNFMFVRELQSKVAINKIRGYDYAEFRINIPISQTSMQKLTSTQDVEQPNRIKRSYIINIDVKELEGKLIRRGAASHSSFANSTTRPTTSSSYTRSGYNGSSNGSRRGSNAYIRKGV